MSAERRWPTYTPRGVTLDAAVFDESSATRGALRVRDSEGNIYIDAIAGIGSCALGHGHPAWVEAIASQAGRLAGVANTFWHEPQQRLAAELAARFPISDARTFFCNSGAESTEAGLKLALRATGRDMVIAFERAFHGRTLGAIALTANPKYRDPYVQTLGEEPERARFCASKVLHLPFDDIPALEAAFAEHGPRIAAVFVEPIQGEGGVWPASKAFLIRARELCSSAGALLGLDEIQSGSGRSGHWSAWQTLVGDEIEPDIVWLAKALGGGFPIGACLTTPALAEHMGPGSHGTTFGGNPVACAAALATFAVIDEEGLLARARAQLPTLEAIAKDQPLAEVRDIRGAGAMIGIQLGEIDAGRAKAIAPALAREGVLVTTPGGHTLRLLLPYAADREILAAIWAAIGRACAATPVQA